MSGALPHDRLPIHNNKTADPVQGSATTSIAATGMPPVPHEREAAIVARPHPFGHRADRMARYKVIRQRRTARSLRGDWSERDAPLRRLRAPACLTPSPTGRATPRPGRSGAVRGRPRLETRVEESHRGERAAKQLATPGGWARAGLRSSRGSTHPPDGRRLSAPTPGTSVPCPAPRGAADEGDAASARGDLTNSKTNPIRSPIQAAGAYLIGVVVSRL